MRSSESVSMADSGMRLNLAGRLPNSRFTAPGVRNDTAAVSSESIMISISDPVLCRTAESANAAMSTA